LHRARDVTHSVIFKLNGTGTENEHHQLPETETKNSPDETTKIETNRDYSEQSRITTMTND